MFNKIASNTIAQIVSKAITAFISIFLIGILTKYLPIELYGSYNKVYNYLGIFAFLADLWLYAITIREIARKQESAEKIIGNVLTLRTIMWLGIWIGACMIAFMLPSYNDALTLIAIFIIGAFTLVSLINSSILALMQSQMKMEFSLISVVSGKILNLLLVSIFLIIIFTDVSQYSLSFISVFVAAFLWITLNTIMNYFYAKKIVPIRYRFDSQYIKHIFKISLPYGIALFLSVVYFKIDIILLSLIEAPEKADISIALYSLPMKIVEVLMVLWGFYLNSLLPTLTEKFKQNNTKDISHILGISLKILISFWILIFLMWNLFSKELISVIATPEYLNPTWHIYSSAGVLSIVVWVLLFHFISLAFIYMLIASEKQSLLVWINLCVTLINIVWNLILIPHYSFYWAALVTLLSQIILMWITWYVVLRKISISLHVLRHILFSMIFAWCIFVLSNYILSSFSFGDIFTLLLIAPCITFIYILGEYMFSKNIFQKN